MWRMLVGCGAGVILGTMLLGVLPESWLSILLAGLILTYLGIRLLRPTLQISPKRARNVAAPVGLLTGILQGATGISAPVGVTFIVAQRLPRESQIFVLSVMFIVLTGTQTVSLVAVGLMTSSLFKMSLLALVPMALGIWFGQYLGRRFSTHVFDILTMLLLFATAIGLLAGAVPDIAA